MEHPSMPKRNPKSAGSKSIKIYKFSELIGKKDEELLSNHYNGIYIDDSKVLIDNFDFFKHVISFKEYDKIYSKDFECLKFIENNLPDFCNLELSLIDDFENKDRSYIITSEFEKTSLTIPMIYTMWNAKIQDNQSISGYYNLETTNPQKISNFSNISLSFLKWLKETIAFINTQCKDYSEVEKLIIISNYLQNNVQFVDDKNISESTRGTIITDSKDVVVGKNVHSPQTVLQQRFGVCEGIANATTLLLNNPTFNLNIRSVLGNDHVWNVVMIDGQYYYTDNTWSITRNNNQYPESLKAQSFCSDYLLFGSKTSDKIGHHMSATIVPQISLEDYSKQKIACAVKKLSPKTNFSHYDKPVFESHVKK